MSVSWRDVWAVVKASAERRLGKPLLIAYLVLAIFGVLVVGVSMLGPRFLNSDDSGPVMGLWSLFRRQPTTPVAPPAVSVSRGAPFVLTLDGALYADESGRATDVFLAAGAPKVLGAGRLVATQGRVLAITNESPAYRPTLADMRMVVRRLDAMGLDLSAGGKGALVIVYAQIDESGVGTNGARYRVAKSAAGADLVPE